MEERFNFDNTNKNIKIYRKNDALMMEESFYLNNTQTNNTMWNKF